MAGCGTLTATYIVFVRRGRRRNVGKVSGRGTLCHLKLWGQGRITSMGHQDFAW